MAKGIQIWRWKQQRQWVCTHRDHTKECATPEDFGGLRGQAENDWLIVDAGHAPHGGPRQTNEKKIQIPNSSVPPKGTVWYWSSSNDRWVAIYRRSGAPHPKLPEALSEIRGEDGEVVIDTSASPRPIPIGVEYLHDGHFTIFKPGGGTEHVVYDVTAVFDDFEDGEGAGLNPAFEAPAAIPPDANERRIESDLEFVDRLLANSEAKRRMKEAQRTSKPEKFAAFVKWFFQEATPSPTPGTTAPLDYISAAREWDAAASRAAELGSHDGQLEGFRFVGEDGGAASDNRGFMAQNDAKVLSLTSQVLGSVGAIVDYVEQLKKISHAYDNVETALDLGEADSVSGSAAATASADSVKAVTGILTSMDVIANAVNKASSLAQGTSAVAQGIPFVGTAVSLFTIGRTTRKTRRAGVRREQLKNMSATIIEMNGVLKFMLGKTLRKTRLGKASVGTAVTGGSGGTILGVTAVVGGANAWNPAGWILLGVSAVGGLGVVTYKVYRRARRQSRHANRAENRMPRDAKDAADRLIRIARDVSHSDSAMAIGVLDLFGVPQADALYGNPVTISNKVDRHLQHA